MNSSAQMIPTRPFVVVFHCPESLLLRMRIKSRAEERSVRQIIMKVFLLSLSILHLLSVAAPSVSGSQCPEDKVWCVSQDLPLRALCLDRESLRCTLNCRPDALLNISGLQCQFRQRGMMNLVCMAIGIKFFYRPRV